ncbi:hypothetical protein CA54_16560 [Symmachiella macrocystis]|uniref:Uncharacterized protein n=1 Tax=Symmachiella macrocystis TaxID=2527985 RepID=A0A5C6BL61_9PLAN|nr:hypothetical protein CA54_16560 [Symmachiella macrocystis]
MAQPHRLGWAHTNNLAHAGFLNQAVALVAKLSATAFFVRYTNEPKAQRA